MDDYCGSVFWDTDTNQGQLPNFTSCFRNTILVWIPCIFLWIFAPLEIYYIFASKSHTIPNHFINTSKMALITLVASLNLRDTITNVLSNPVISIYLHNAVLKFVTFVLCLTLTWGNLKRGIRSSGILFCFSLISVVCALPQLIHFVMPVSHSSEIKVDPNMYTIYFITIALIFGMNCFADPKPQHSLREFSNERTCPAHGASFISKTFLLWFNRYISQNREKPVEENLWNLDYDDSTSYLNEKYRKYLNDFCSHVTTSQEKNSITRFLLKIFACDYLVVIFWSTIAAIFLISPPIIFSFIIICLKNNKPSWVLSLCAFSFLLLNVFCSIVYVQMFMEYSNVIIRIRAILMSMIYKKVLRITDRARNKFTSGEIVTLITLDVQNVAEGVRCLLYFWLTPLQIFVTIYYIWRMYGLGTVVTVVVLFLLIPVNMYFIGIMKKLSHEEKTYKNERGKFLQDLLAGIKILKMYSWESSFLQKASTLREEEYKNFVAIGFQQAAIYGFFNLLPLFMSCPIFVIYMYESEELIDLEKAFLMIAFFNSLVSPFRLCSVFAINVMQGYSSAKKINEFLHLQEMSNDIVSHDVTDNALVIENGTFSWISPKGEPVLTDLNLKIPKGAMVIVIGPVGAGKSSLLSAFLGELYKIAGYVNVNGKIAYVPQQAWILNTSFKENITIGRKVDDSTYQKALYACALNEDLQSFPAGDKTEIGEKGINLSGGQKQRINLARAICCDADIYLFDDSFSSVDFNVSKHVSDNVLGRDGLLKNKTKILITHNVTFLSHSDLIIYLKDGKIAKTETSDGMTKTNEHVSEFQLSSINNTNSESTNIEEFCGSNSDLK